MVLFMLCLVLGIGIGSFALWLIGNWQPKLTGKRQSNRHHL